jgi:hypothetical protein
MHIHSHTQMRTHARTHAQRPGVQARTARAHACRRSLSAALNHSFVRSPRRIEIEGGDEVPIMDGSSLGWALEVQWAGLRTATGAAGKEQPRLALRPKEPVVVRGDDGAFIQLVPEGAPRLTVGVDACGHADIIGAQWLSWSPLEDMHYRFELSSAREYAESPEEVAELRNMGYYVGGTDGCVLVAFGDRWWEPQLLRHAQDEAVRHAMADLIGGWIARGWGFRGNEGDRARRGWGRSCCAPRTMRPCATRRQTRLVGHGRSVVITCWPPLSLPRSRSLSLFPNSRSAHACITSYVFHCRRPVSQRRRWQRRPAARPRGRVQA